METYYESKIIGAFITLTITHWELLPIWVDDENVFEKGIIKKFKSLTGTPYLKWLCFELKVRLRITQTDSEGEVINQYENYKRDIR